MRSSSNIFALALAAAATAPGCWAQDAPNQQCRDDAGPSWADMPVYYENRDIPTYDTPLVPDDGECPEPLAEACATKSTKAAYMEGPISCPAGKGWFCRIAFQDGWSREMGEQGEGYLIDSNFMHCNQTSEDGGHDGDGHCHGSDADSTYGWWVRDHWNRGYAGTLNCCCGWSDLQELAIVNRCDYRHTVFENNTDRKYRPDSCRDANEEHGMGFDLRGDGDSAGTPAGCPATGNPTFSDPLDANPGQCWSVQNFGYNDSPPGTRPPTRPATPTPPPASSAPTPPPPTSRPNGQPTSTPPPVPCASDPSWRDDAFNGCNSDQINAAWCRDAGDEMFRQADARMMSGNQACTQCGACNTAPTTSPPTTHPPATPAPTTGGGSPGGNYVLDVAGTCSGTEAQTRVTSRDECAEAAEALDLSDVTAGQINTANRPPGCFFKPSNSRQRLYWNVNAGTDVVDGQRPVICRTTGDQPPPPPPSFVLREVGNCNDAGDHVESESECEEAAEALDLEDTTVTLLEDKPDRPTGCYYKDSNSRRKLYFNVAGDQDSGDTARVSICMGRLAVAVDAEAAPFRQTTSTAEPNASVSLTASTRTDAANPSTTDSAPAVIGAVFGVIIMTGLVVGVLVMRRRRLAGRSSKETAPATVEEGLSLRIKSVRRGNPAFVTSVVGADQAGNTGI